MRPQSRIKQLMQPPKSLSPWYESKVVVDRVLLQIFFFWASETQASFCKKTLCCTVVLVDGSLSEVTVKVGSGKLSLHAARPSSTAWHLESRKDCFSMKWWSSSTVMAHTSCNSRAAGGTARRYGVGRSNTWTCEFAGGNRLRNGEREHGRSWRRNPCKEHDW